MAIKVPIAQEQIDTRSAAGAVPTPQSSRPPIAAFGGDVADANAKVANAVGNMGDLIAKHAVQQAEWKSERYAVDTFERFKKDSQNILDNPTVEDQKDAKGNIVGQRPAGLLRRMESQADGVTQEYDQKSKALFDQYMGNVKNSPVVANAFYKAATSYMSSKRDEVIGHEAKQFNLSYTNTQMKAIGNTMEDVAKDISPDPKRNAVQLKFGLEGAGGIRERVDQLSKFQGKDGSEAESAYRDVATKTIERSVTNITRMYGADAGKAQLTAFSNVIDSDKFNKLSTTVDHIQRQMDAKANHLARMQREATTHELLDLANANLLAPQYLEEKFLTHQISNTLYEQLQKKTTSDVGPTAHTDAQTYYDLTHYLLQDNVDAEKGATAILQASNAGKISPADAKKISDMHLVSSQNGKVSLRQALANGGFDKSKEAFDAELQAVADKRNWFKSALTKIESIFSGPDRLKGVADTTKKMIDHYNKAQMKPEQLPAAADTVVAAEHLKRHPEWAKLPETGMDGHDRHGNPVTVYPDGRIVRRKNG